jgi:CRP-like cAMP-binding protein
VQSPVNLKLDYFALLTERDHRALEKLIDTAQTVEAHYDLMGEKLRPGLHFLTDGYAFQSTTLRDGRRQIISLLLPGDEFFPRPGYAIHTVTDVTYVEAPKTLLNSPGISKAITASASINAAMLHERIISLGVRSAKERISHLFCEWFQRSRLVGLTTKMQCTMPLNQTEVGDMMGLSLVHTNRSLQSLRAENLVRLEFRKLTILNLAGLKAVGHFSPGYLSFKAEKTSPVVKRKSARDRDLFGAVAA